MEAVTAAFTLLPALVILFIVVIGLIRKVDVYKAFVKGAKQGVGTALRILPYVCAMLVAIALLRSSGALSYVESALAPVLGVFGAPREISALFIVRPFSGSAALSVMSDIFKQYGPDSAVGMLASVLMGSSETVFYTVSLYFASVGIERTRHVIPACLIGALVSLIASVWVCRLLL